MLFWPVVAEPCKQSGGEDGSRRFLRPLHKNRCWCVLKTRRDCSHWACTLGLRVLGAALLLCRPEPWQPAARNLSRGVLGRLGVLLGVEAEWGVGQCHLDSAGSSPEPGEGHGWPGSLQAPAGASERGAQGSLRGVRSLMSPSPKLATYSSSERLLPHTFTWALSLLKKHVHSS